MYTIRYRWLIYLLFKWLSIVDYGFWILCIQCITVQVFQRNRNNLCSAHIRWYIFEWWCMEVSIYNKSCKMILLPWDWLFVCIHSFTALVHCSSKTCTMLFSCLVVLLQMSIIVNRNAKPVALWIRIVYVCSVQKEMSF